MDPPLDPHMYSVFCLLCYFINMHDSTEFELVFSGAHESVCYKLFGSCAGS